MNKCRRNQIVSVVDSLSATVETLELSRKNLHQILNDECTFMDSFHGNGGAEYEKSADHVLFLHDATEKLDTVATTLDEVLSDLHNLTI